MLKLDGKPFKQVLPARDAIQRFLDKSGGDEVFSPATLSSKLSLSTSSVRDQVASLGKYTLAVGNSRYWGNPKAIAELRRQVEA